jgi:hypothetical protein
VGHLKYLGTTLKNHNNIIEEIQSRLKSGNACCLHSRFCNSTKIKIYRNIILPLVLYGCGTWSLTLREDHKPRVFENRMLRKIFGSKRNGVMRGVGKIT